jgi:signal transduction histidine kinase
MRARVALRTRLVAIYAAVFVTSTAAVLIVSYVLLATHLEDTLPAGTAGPILSDLASQYVLTLIGTTLVAVSLGWFAARRLLRPLQAVTEAARHASDERLDERVRVGGPHDELRELGDTFDAMLDRFQESIENQRRFIANASHELRSPLTAIRTEVDVTLADPDASNEELRVMGERVLEGADQLDDLLGSLMVLARSQRGLLRSAPTDFADVARRAVSDAIPVARAAGIELVTELREAPIVGDEPLLRRLVANLIDNAVRYNRPAGFVRVEVWTEGANAILRTSNSGPIIPPDQVERLREPFERLGRHGDGGTGLGLSIVQAVAEAHRGTVRLMASPEGGLDIVVLLPLAVTARGANTAVRTVHTRA